MSPRALDESTVHTELTLILGGCATIPPAPPEVIRTMLARARDAGLDWRRIYLDADGQRAAEPPTGPAGGGRGPGVAQVSEAPAPYCLPLPFDPADPVACVAWLRTWRRPDPTTYPATECRLRMPPMAPARTLARRPFAEWETEMRRRLEHDHPATG